MLKELGGHPPAARTDAASRIVDAIVAASSTGHGVPVRDDLEAFLFVVDVGAFESIGRPITDLPWVRGLYRLEERPEWSRWISRLRFPRHSEHESSPGTAFLSGLELEVIRRSVELWWSLEDDERSSISSCMRFLETEPTPQAESVWDIRRLRKEREARLREGLSAATFDEPPRPTQSPEETEAIAAAVLETIASHDA